MDCVKSSPGNLPVPPEEMQRKERVTSNDRWKVTESIVRKSGVNMNVACTLALFLCHHCFHLFFFSLQVCSKANGSIPKFLNGQIMF